MSYTKQEFIILQVKHFLVRSNQPGSKKLMEVSLLANFILRF